LAVNRSYFRILALASLAAILIAALAWPNRDERAIRRRLHALARQCEKKPGQGMIRTLADMADLRAAFTSNAVIQLGRPYPLRPSPRELASLVARAQMEVASLEILIQGVEFLPRAEPDAIEMVTAVALRVRRDDQAEEFVDEYRLRWRKENGEWRIESARADSAIRAPWP
jgi:hypothetical protein